MTVSPDSEQQLHGLRRGLKLIACLLSPLLTIQLYAAIANLFRARELAADMGAALPGLVRLLTSQPLLIQALPLLSFACFITILILCLRNRGNAFLYLFGVSLFLHLCLDWLINLAAGLPLQQMMRALML